MSDPSPGLAIAWRIAASEAGAAGYPKIECPHLMMGLLSLDKGNPKALKDLGFDPVRMGEVAAEQAAISELFEAASLTPRALRRDLRTRVKKKPQRAKGVMSRSAALKAVFARAELLAGAKPLNSLHLLTVLLKAPDPAIVSLLLEHHLGPDIATRAEAAASLPFDRMVAGPLGKTRAVAPRGPSPAPQKADPARLLKLEAHLKSKVIGQDEAVAKVASRVKLAHSGLSERRGPLAVFLFTGPSGVGKTETAQTLARFLNWGTDDFARFDMSDYTAEPGVSKFIGAGPDGSGQLTQAILDKPTSVIVFDGIEKAHAKVFEVLVKLFEAGRLTGVQGGVADARNVIVVMTMGAGADAKGGKSTETMPVTKTGRMKAELRRFFRPEFMNRVDDVVTFRALDEADVRRIARPLLAGLITKVRKTNGVLLRIDPEAEAFVIRSGFNAQKGVRELKPVIERLVERPLSSLAQSGKLAQHPAWKAVYDEGGLYFLPDQG